MADYIYTMEVRLTPEQQRGVVLVQDVAVQEGGSRKTSRNRYREIVPVGRNTDSPGKSLERRASVGRSGYAAGDRST